MTLAETSPSTDRRFACTWEGCEKQFNRKSDLARHMRIHTNCRPFKCTWQGCDKAFIQRSALTVHMRTHTGEKPHVCGICDRAFSDSSSLARHRRTHLNDKPFACPEKNCNKHFSRRASLNRHVRQHIDLKAAANSVNAPKPAMIPTTTPYYSPPLSISIQSRPPSPHRVLRPINTTTLSPNTPPLSGVPNQILYGNNNTFKNSLHSPEIMLMCPPNGLPYPPMDHYPREYMERRPLHTLALMHDAFEPLSYDPSPVNVMPLSNPQIYGDHSARDEFTDILQIESAREILEHSLRVNRNYPRIPSINTLNI